MATRNGNIRLGLPRSFVGTITTRTLEGTVQYSSNVTPHMAVFSEMKSVRKAFLGNYDRSQYGALYLHQ